jgi:phi LC3 family holin
VKKLKLNIKARLKNKTFLISIAVLTVALIYRVLSLFGVFPTVAENEILELIGMAVNILALVGVVVDPTTEGLNDSERAMTYFTENDVRVLEGRK